MEDWRVDWSRYKINKYGELVDVETGEVVSLYEYYHEYTPSSLREAIESLLRI